MKIPETLPVTVPPKFVIVIPDHNTIVLYPNIKPCVIVQDFNDSHLFKSAPSVFGRSNMQFPVPVVYPPRQALAPESRNHQRILLVANAPVGCLRVVAVQNALTCVLPAISHRSFLSYVPKLVAPDTHGFATPNDLHGFCSEISLLLS